ncbi:uncharacterized protein LOC144564462 [Carex rostrata]
MVEEGNENEVNNRAAWNELQKTFLVELLVEFDRLGTRQQNTWSKVAWNDMARRFKAKFIDSSFSVKQLKEQERTLKKLYKTIQRLRNQSGFGWDPTRKMVVATEEVWTPILQTDKEAKRWYNKSFPYYDDLHDLYAGCIANGSRRRGSNYYANRENQFVMDSPSPTIPAPGGFNLDFEEDYPNTQAFDLISTQAQVSPSTQSPVDGHTPPTRVPSPGGQTRLEREKLFLNFMRIIWTALAGDGKPVAFFQSNLYIPCLILEELLPKMQWKVKTSVSDATTRWLPDDLDVLPLSTWHPDEEAVAPAEEEEIGLPILPYEV